MQRSRLLQQVPRPLVGAAVVAVVAASLVGCGGDGDEELTVSCGEGTVASRSGVGDPGAPHAEPGGALADVEAVVGTPASAWVSEDQDDPDLALFVVRDGGEVRAVAEVERVGDGWVAGLVVGCDDLVELGG